MRISTQQVYTQSVYNMQQSQLKLAELNEQIATGKRIQSAADDPVGAAQMVALNEELAQLEKYESNIGYAQNSLDLEEAVLSDINIAMDRMSELTVQAGSSTLSNNDRESIANELRGLTEYVAGLMNTQTASGEYIFAGSQGHTQPFVQDGNGHYPYQGDDGQRQIQAGASFLVTTGDPGSEVFMAVPGTLDVSLLGVDTDALAVVVTDETSADAMFSDAGDLHLSIAEDALGHFSYSLNDSSGNALGDPALSNVAFTPPDTLEYEGLCLTLNPTGAADITLRGETPQQSILDVALDLADALEQPVTGSDDQQRVSDAVAQALSDIDSAQEQLLSVQTAIGARSGALERQLDSNQELQLITKSTLSSIEDTDLTTAITDLQLEQILLEASQVVFGQVTGMSLFDYIR
ncbi:flagellar hook-associated protein FlgL [Pontibacterium sp. N1Y112]|uniref:Flagellar hook-associated protein FlgL n=1 Tax=Pontibacterium sinense TaxID=2781979 RepID=A0A8J7K747_9GAMM|nr:flagellar hook-associated protein FlgL [Pontibacterium sinense]MBE9397826.1 flagellar hook-associated protein FlgL [Pontibacterium sinense]